MSFNGNTLQRQPEQRTRSESADARAKLAIDTILRAALETASDNNSETPEAGKPRKVEFPAKEAFDSYSLASEAAKSKNQYPAQQVFDIKEEARMHCENELMTRTFTTREPEYSNPKIILGPVKKLTNKETRVYVKKGTFSSAYMKRNVYKSIIRHMLSYVRKNTLEIIDFLQSHGFKVSEIEDAIYKINHFNELEKEKGNPKQSQVILKNIISKRGPCTYILKETLNGMQNDWTEGKLGKISAQNLKVYREVCDDYYTAILKVLN
eukprot:TRINITY_DN6537_c0_g1_i6.p1 TRINITY_DN6537_c0_g1~~TRINITY_DN6537_c0_g1_i6.p1  ORF type:complete len:266 (+),score=50.79 TRINITY_DN6537_c0_g1_i6:259-1056(+)